MKTIKEIDKIALLHIKNGKIRSAKSKGKNKYYIPGGKRESGESDKETLIRETFEELNVRIEQESINYIATFRAQADGHETGIIVKMTCYRAEIKGVPKPSSEIEDIKWLDSSNMDIIADVDKKIFRYLREKGILS